MTISTRMGFTLAVVTAILVGAPAGAQEITITDLANPGETGSATGANDSGQVVGYVQDSLGVRRAFIWTQEEGRQNLGNLGGEYARAYRINNLGHVTGLSETAEGHQHAFLWTEDEGMMDLGTLGGSWCASVLVNETGTVVGWSYLPSGDLHAFWWTAAAGMHDMGTLGGNYSLARDLNELGQVVGQSTTASGEMHAFVWSQEAGIQDLHIPGAAGTVALAINDLGQIAGAYSIEEDGFITGQFAFLRNPDGAVHDLGTLGGNFSAPGVMNNSGQVAGTSSAVPYSDYRVFRWTEQSGMEDLGTLGGQGNVSASGINDLGMIVGHTNTSEGYWHAFVWTENSGMQDLGTLGGLYSSAIGINNLGQVVGSAHTTAGEAHPVVWNIPLGVTDSDGDGIEDDVDEEPNKVSKRFSDGVTSGQVVRLDNGITIEISDAPNAEDGIRLFVSGPETESAQIRIDGSKGVGDYSPGLYILTFNTVTIEVIEGQAEIEYLINGSPVVVTVQGTALIEEQIVDDELTALIVNALDGYVAVDGGEVVPGTSKTVLSVTIDIKPNEEPNCFNANGSGVIPVAVLSDGGFDATQVDPATVSLDGQSVRLVGKGTIQAHIEDVNGDGLDDLVVQIADEDGSYEEGESIGTLTTETFDGISIIGTDTICVVP